MNEGESDEDDWESAWTKGRFDQAKEGEGDKLINDDCDKQDDDNCDDDCGDIISYNFSITDLESLIFPFSIRWKW